MRRMNNLSLLNKKGVSVMVGYVLLIAIAVALSTAVFFYLKLYLPDERPECNVDVKLTIEELTCTLVGAQDSEIDIKIANKGLFNVDGAYIKIGDPDRAFKENLNSLDNLALVNSPCNPGTSALIPGDRFC